MGELDLTIGAMLSQDIEENQIVMRAGERPTIRMMQNRKTEETQLEWLVPPGDVRLLSGAIHSVDPGGGSLGTIRHEGEEVDYVLEGVLQLEVDGTTYHLKQGDSFFIRSDLPHGYHNPGDTVTRTVWVNTPPTF